MRVTGLATGIDVDAAVKQMMQAENIRVDKMKQDRQTVQWRQDLYRDLIGNINTFRSTYFDVLKTNTYMLSKSAYSSFDTSNIKSANVKTSSGAVAGDYKIQVEQLAEKAKIEGKGVVNAYQSVSDFSFPASIDGQNNEIKIDLGGGEVYQINIEDGFYSFSDLAAKVNKELSNINDNDGNPLNKRVKAAVDPNRGIKFVGVQTFDEDQTLKITQSGKDYEIKIEKGTYGMDQLSSAINSKLSSIKGEDGKALSTKLTASVSVDGTYIVYTKENDGDDISADRDFKSDFSITNKEAVGNNRLEYEREIFEGYNDTLNITVDGKRYTAKFAPYAYGKPSSGIMTDKEIREDLVSRFDHALKNAVDSDNTNVDLSGNGIGLSARLSFDGARIELVSKTNKTVSVSGSATNVLGFQPKFEVNMGTKNKASMLLGDPTYGKVKFVVNNGSKEIEFEYDFLGSDQNKTIGNIIDDIYAKTNAKLNYSQLTRKFTLESDGTGADQNVGIKAVDDVDTSPATKLFLGNMFSEDGGLNPDGSIKDFTSLSNNGKDAKMFITNPGGTESVTVIKSTNNFTIDGINYSLTKAGGGEETMTVISNPQKTFDLIKNFVDDYNKMLDSINGKIYEKKQYDYKPLTDEQKKDMKEDDIKNWEDKAKQGLISNDSSLQSMMFNIRSAFYDPIKIDSNDPNSGNLGTYITGIGIKTSSDYLGRGRLVIDERKLKAAIEKDGDKIAELFTKTSSSVPDYSPDLPLGDRKKRYEEQGILQRINDIFQDNLRTTRNANGKKGILLEKAGIKGDYTEFNNTLSDELKEKDSKINELIKKLADKEEKYYLQFARLEKAMNQMNSQSNWMAQQLGSSGNQ